MPGSCLGGLAYVVGFIVGTLGLGVVAAPVLWFLWRWTRSLRLLRVGGALAATFLLSGGYALAQSLAAVECDGLCWLVYLGIWNWWWAFSVGCNCEMPPPMR